MTNDPGRHLDDYLTYARRRYTTPTFKAYRSVLTELHTYTGGTPWGDVTTAELEAFIDRPRKSKTGKPAHATVQRDSAVVRSFYRWLDDERLIDRERKNPASRLVPEKGLQAAQRLPVDDEVWLSIWTAPFVTSDDRLWLGLGYFCGLRVAEMANLQPHSVRDRTERVDSGTLRFFRKGSKKDEGIAYAAIVDLLMDRELGLPDLAVNADTWMDLLESTAAFRHDQMFLLPSSVGRPDYDTHYIWRRLKAIQVKLGVPDDKRVSPHNLRHSAATNLALCGVEPAIIQRQLSHSSPDITAHYTGKAAQQLVAWTARRRAQG